MTDILSAIWGPLGAVVAVLVAVVAAWLRGRSSGATAERRRQTDAYIKTSERIDDADANIDDDPAGSRDWLREYGDE